ncbi:LytR family transcriptional regulator [Levilactobacillus zymae]|uniref:LytR family transcriptional regulator n=1 Tax=Levilactobacillus zymae TaxID=267363 RepID=A0ABQ0WWL5_9LACO|nr:LCP family protein [Levilactobacillus zymae]QFR61157.1 LytR family transcriptional regulator [Levilactobacillus zymae]GEO72151.1 LytR family transcriptional regulator [Levilactobacillus zymae]
MQHRKKTHTVRNVFLTIILLLVVGGAAYGMQRYRSVKESINSSFKASGIQKERNVTQQLKDKKPVSVLLLGTDTGEFNRTDRGRTDSMMVVTLNPKTNKTTITSIPRDTAVSIPGYTSEAPSKINAAYAWGKTKTSIKTVQQMLNIPIDFYALVNLKGLIKVVDKVGGVDVTPTLSFSNLGYTFTKGVKTHMNGKKALAYVDMRYKDPQGDYGRQTRQRNVLMAIVRKTGSVSALLNQDFINSLAEQTQTDLTFDDLTAIAKDYRKATGNIKQTHLQGHGKELSGQDMEVMKKPELQRVTNFIRNGLDLPHKTTGSIALFSSTSSKKSSSSTSTTSDATTAGTTTATTDATGTTDYGY